MRRTTLTRAALVAAAISFALPARAQQFQTPRPSPNATVTQTIGTTDLTLKYSRPGVKGRAIWGALVPYEKAWRTGANEATQFITTDDVTVEGKALPAGTYAVVTFPTAGPWVVAFSRQKEMWGAFAYDEKQDALRVNVTPVTADHVERLQFSFDDPTDESVTLNLRWEKLSVPVRIGVDTKTKVLRDARAAVAAAPADDWRIPYRAANWAVDANVAPDEAAVWAKTALDRKQNFQTATLSAKLAQKKGDSRLATDWLKKSITYGKADTTIEKVQIEANEKLLAEWSTKK